MKKKTGIVAVTAALCALTMSMGIFAACAPEDVKDYTFTEPQITRPAPDEGITIDGVLDEQAYTSRRWIRGVKLVTQNPGDDTSIGKDYDAVVRRLENAATVEMTAVIGEKGIYIGVHVDEGEGIVYMNSDRASFMNSCAELYFALPGNDDIKDTGSLEIDVMPDGTMRLKKNYATGNWDDFPTTYDKASYSAATTDGTINIDAHSYTVEVFLTYEHLDLVQPGASAAIKEEGEIRLNIAPITSYSIDGTTESDRWWWMLGSQLDDGAWGNTDGWYHFDENGLMSYDITIADDIEHGSVMEWVNYDWAAANNSVTFLAKADDGYALTDLTVNGTSYKDNIEYQNMAMTKAAVTIPASAVKENLSVDATFTEFGTEPVQFEASVKGRKVGQDVQFADGTEVNFEGVINYEFTVTDGKISGEIVPGLYDISLSGDGTENYSELLQVSVLPNQALSLTFPYSVFEQYPGAEGTVGNAYANEDDSRVTLVSGEAFPVTTDFYGDSAFTATFKLSQAEQNNGHGIRYIFDDGVAVQPYVKWGNGAHEGKFIVEWVGTTNWGTDSAAGGGNWATVDLPDSFGTAFDDGTGVDLTIVRDGLDFYVFVSIHGQPETRVLSHKLTVDGKYAGQEGRYGIAVWDQRAGAEVPFGVTEDAGELSDLLKLNVTVNQPENGTLTVKDKDSLTVNDELVITVEPEDGYIVRYLKVNGEEVAVTNGEYRLEKADLVAFAVNYVLEAAFEAAESANVTFDVTPVQRLGASVDMNGKTLVFAGAGTSKTAVVTDGKVTLDLYKGIDYIVTVQGESYYGSVAVTSETKDPIAFTYDVFTENLFGSGGGTLDESKANDADASVTNVNAGKMWAATNETFGDSAFTMTIQQSDFTNEYLVVAFMFDDGKYVMASLTLQDGHVRAEWRGEWGAFGLDDRDNLKFQNWDGATCSQFDEALAGDGVDLTVVRSGNSFYMFLSAHGEPEGAVLANSFTVDEAYQTTKGHWALGAVNATKNAAFEFVLAEGADAVENWTDLLYFHAEATAQDENGQIELSAGKALLDGGSITVTVTANIGYAVEKLLVNGEDRTAELSDGKLTLTAADCPDGDRTIVVSVTFTEATPISVTAEVSALRFGQEVDLEGVDVLFSGSKNETLTVEKGEITGMIVPGTYTVTLVGMSYNSISVTIANDGTVSANDGDKLAFTYDMFMADTGVMDDSHENDENAYLVNGAAGDLWAISNDKFGDSAVTVTLQKSDFTGEYAPIGYIFDDNKLVMATFKNSLRAEWRDDFLPFNLSTANLLHSSGWNGTDFPALSEAFEGDGIDFTLVRDGLHFYIFVSAHGSNEKFLATQITISDAYASQQGHWAIGVLGAAQDAQIEFVLVEDAGAVEDLVKLDVTVQTATNGSVTVENKDALTVGDEVKITVTPEEGYLLDELTVNGSTVTPSGDAAAYSYTYRLPNGAKPEVTVGATFFASEEVSATVTVSPVQRLGASVDMNGRTLVFVGDYGRLTHEAVVADGQVTVSLHTGVEYTVTVKDEPYYVSQSMTGAASATVSFIYDAFSANGIGANEGTAIDDSNANTDKYITATEGGRIWAVMNEGSLNSVFKATFSSKTSTAEGEFRTVVYTFEDKAAVIPLVKKGDGDQIKVEWQGWAEFGLNNMLNNVWNSKQYGGALYKAYNGDGIDFIVVRSGRTVYVFLSEADKPETAVFFDSYTFDEKYEDVAGHFGIGIGNDAPAGSKLYFDYSEDAEEVAAWLAKVPAQE